MQLIQQLILLCNSNYRSYLQFHNSVPSTLTPMLTLALCPCSALCSILAPPCASSPLHPALHPRPPSCSHLHYPHAPPALTLVLPLTLPSTLARADNLLIACTHTGSLYPHYPTLHLHPDVPDTHVEGFNVAANGTCQEPACNRSEPKGVLSRVN